jgi:hypothetical protein
MATNLKIQSCSVSAGLNAREKAAVAEYAKRYNTDDPTADYIAGLSDLLEVLRADRDEVRDAYNKALTTIKEQRKADRRKRKEKAAEDAATKEEQEVARRKAAIAESTRYASPEEAWEDLGPDDVPYSRLMAYTENELIRRSIAKWNQYVVENRATQSLAESIATLVRAENAEVSKQDFVSKSTYDELLDEINVAETYSDIRDFQGAIPTIVHYAFFDTDSNNLRRTVPRALEFMQNTNFSPEELALIREAVVAQANDKVSLEAYNKSKSNKGMPKPWFSFAKRYGVLPYIRTQSIKYIPVEEATELVRTGQIGLWQLPQSTFETIAEAATAELKFSNNDPPSIAVVQTPQSIVARMMDELLKLAQEQQKVNGRRRKEVNPALENMANSITALYSKVDERNRNYLYQGKRLREFFTTDGKPIAAAEFVSKASIVVDDDYDGAFIRDDGTPIKSSIPIGRVRLFVNNLMNKFRVKPKTYVYANVEDLKRSNPELYKRAAAARPQGDFDSTKAMGYSFGGWSRAATTGVSRREFFKGMAAVAAASKVSLKGLNRKELWDRYMEVLSGFDDSLEKFSDSNIYSNIYNNSYSYVTANTDGNIREAFNRDRVGSIWDFIEAGDDVFAETGDDGAFPKITEDDVSKFQNVLQEAMKLAQQQFEKERPAAEAAEKAAASEPTVIIFSDFIRTEQQLRFVLAHETIGHLGLRAVLSKAELEQVLNRIYASDPSVRAQVDRMVEQGMSKLEAIEEHIADYAATIDSSIVMRIWNAIKSALNKLGIKFADDDARYIVGLARKYTRTGMGGRVLSQKSIAEEIREQYDAYSDGRYLTVHSSGELATRAVVAGGMNSRFGTSGRSGFLGALDAFHRGVFGIRQNVPGTVARVLESVQTLDNKARRSYGLSLIYRMLERQQRFARSLLSKYQQMTQFSHAADYGALRKFAGSNIPNVTDQEREQAGELLAHAALFKSEAFNATVMRSLNNQRLVIQDPQTGVVSINTEVREMLEEIGSVTPQQFRDGLNIKYSTGDVKQFKRDVDENSNVWKIYQEMRATVNEAAIDLLLANYEAAQAEGKRAVGRLNENRSSSNAFTNEDLTAIRDAARRYRQISYEASSTSESSLNLDKEAVKRAEKFTISFGRAIFDDRIYAVWMKDPNAMPEIVEEMKEFQQAEYDDLREALGSIRAKVLGDEATRKKQSYDIQKSIRDMFLFDFQSKNAELYAKRTIAGGYVPFSRRGTEQVVMSAYDANGNPVKLSETVRGVLPYFQFEDRAEAVESAADLAKTFTAETEWTLLDANEQEVRVTLRPEISRVRQTPDLTEAVNFNEFVYVLNRLNINLTPEVRERIVTTMTNQNDRARKNLMRSGVPGWDKDVVRSVSEFLETTAHVAAKKLFRHRIDDVVVQKSNWFGSEETLRTLKNRIAVATTDLERHRAQREYDQYAYMYRYMAPTAAGRTVEVAGKEYPTLGRGEEYRDEAVKLLKWYADTGNISDSTEDLLSGETGSAIKMATVVMQLGGSVATAALNMFSIPTHSLPYLAYYNTETGVGGGYGEAKAARALFEAMRNMKTPGMGDAEFFQKTLDDGTYAKYGLTKDEAEFLRTQSNEGVTQAAQFNALIGTARGKAFANKPSVQSAIQLWMSMFTYTEQLNRRTTALAAYRLEKERKLAQGASMEDALAAATEAAQTAVNTSQGEYAMFNRPELARGGLTQYIFMYKQFVIITVQLLRAMPIKGRMMMLGLLLLFSGLRGLPFAEDLMDILDTIMQKLGLKTASVEKELAEFLDTVAPGMTPVAMRGVLDGMMGATLSTRLGMGDLLPLTGAFRAGADPMREVENFAGPAASAITGLVSLAAGLTKYGAEVVGLRDDTTSISTLLRDSPLAFLRAAGDSAAYLSSGTITNSRGQVVSEDVGMAVVLSRLLGFYPEIATQQNDVVRLSKYVSEYAKSLKADYVGAYVKAQLAGDNERMNDIAASVREWNADAEGTGLAIPNFMQSANRAATEAARPTVMRYLKSAPKNVRPETLQMLELYGISPEELSE